MAVARDVNRFKASNWKTAKQWRRWENVGLQPTLDLTDLLLNWTDRRVTDLEARGAITSIELERTIEGASTLTIVLRDPDARLFSHHGGRFTWRKNASNSPGNSAMNWGSQYVVRNGARCRP